MLPADWVREARVGINLGNVLDAPYEGRWAPIARERYFDDYARAGFSSVRIPVRWDKHTERVAPFRVDPAFLARVEQVVGWSLKRGFRTIVNTHHDDWLDGAKDTKTFEAELARFVSVWSQVSKRFANASDGLLAFEVYNEPHLNMNVGWLNAMNSAVLPVLRTHNPTRNVLLGGLRWMNPGWIVANPDALVFPEDPHLLLEVHSYDPYSFCGSHGDLPLEPSWDAASVDKWVDSLHAWATQKQISIVLGEFGCNITQQNRTGRYAWYQHVTRHARSNGWAAMVWDDGGHFAIYNRNGGGWDHDALAALGLDAKPKRKRPAMVEEAEESEEEQHGQISSVEAAMTPT